MNTHKSLRFCFELDAVDEIQPWGEAGEGQLHWFGLTSGRYWLSTPFGEALRYTQKQQKKWNDSSPYVDYQVARLFEDLHGVLPFALEPVPSDIAARAPDPAWYARSVAWMDEGGGNDDERMDIWYGANQWWNDRHIDTAYLVNGPGFHFWRVGDEVFVRWELTSPVEDFWETPNCRLGMDVADFQSASFEFIDEVVKQMGERVQLIAAQGWTRKDCFLDVEALVHEQQQRATWAEEMKARRAATDWASVREYLHRLDHALNQT